MLLPLLEQLRVTRPVGRPRTRPEAVLGDKAYSSRAIRTHLRARGIKAVIPEPADQQGHRRRRGARGGRPVSLDAAAYKGRNVIERQYAHLKQWRGLATRYDKYAIIYRAAVVLNAVIAWSKRLSDMPYGQGTPGHGFGAPLQPGQTDGVGRSVASMILGIISVVGGFTFLLPPIVGVVLGHIGLRREPHGRGMAIAGLVMNYVSLALLLLAVVFLVILVIAGISLGDYTST